MPKVIVFNAPPRAGKDLACEFLMKEINGDISSSVTAHHLSFKAKLVEMTALIFGMTVDEFLVDYDEPWLDYWHKDKLLDRLTIGGKPHSQRSALIYVSEKVAKPMFGEAVWGHALVNAISQVDDSSIVLVSDSGFNQELRPIIDLVGGENVMVIVVYRDGCNFDNDSRDYLDMGMHQEVPMWGITNNGTIDQYLDAINDIVGDFYNER